MTGLSDSVLESLRKQVEEDYRCCRLDSAVPNLVLASLLDEIMQWRNIASDIRKYDKTTTPYLQPIPKQLSVHDETRLREQTGESGAWAI